MSATFIGHSFGTFIYSACANQTTGFTDMKHDIYVLHEEAS